MASYQIIKIIIAVWLAIGGISFCVNQDSTLGKKFQEGFFMSGRMILSIAGIMTITPVLAAILKPVIVPVFRLIGADPACFAILLGCDMGGYSLAISLAESQDVARMMGLAPAAMFGGTLTFAIPVAKAMLTDEDFQLFSKGMLMGILTIPIGSISGGIIQGVEWKTILINNVPLVLFSILLALGFRFCPERLVHATDIFGKVIAKLGIIGLIIGGFSYMTGFTVIPGMPSVMEGMKTVCGMVFLLAGTMPFLEFLTRAVSKHLNKIGRKAALDTVSISGLFFTLASCVPTFAMMKDMTKRGIVINSAWLVCCVGLLGNQMGFLLQEAPEMLFPFVFAKVIAGGLGMVIVLHLTADMKEVQEIKKYKNYDERKRNYESIIN